MTNQTYAHRPMLIFFDGACPLCSREVRHYQACDLHHRIEWIDIAAPDFNPVPYNLTLDQLQRVMHVITPDGRIHTEVAAFVQIWEALPPTAFTTLLRGILKIPGMMALAGVLYRLFARNRHRLTGRCPPASCRLPGKPN